MFGFDVSQHTFFIATHVQCIRNLIRLKRSGVERTPAVFLRIEVIDSRSEETAETQQTLSLSGRVQLDGVIYNNHTVYETVGVLLNSQSDVRMLVGIIRLGDVQEGCAEPHDQENYIRLRFLQIKAETQTNPPGLIQTPCAGSVSPDTGSFKSQNHQNNTNSSEQVIEPEVRGQNYHRDHPVSQQLLNNRSV